MKNFKVTVDNHKVEFFKTLLDHLDFISYEEVDSFYEPRVYPAADFEIRSGKDKASAKKNEKTVSSDDERLIKDAFKDIRAVVSQIDKLRDKSK
jgi:transcription antitermination factor NusG